MLYKMAKQDLLFTVSIIRRRILNLRGYSTIHDIKSNKIRSGTVVTPETSSVIQIRKYNDNVNANLRLSPQFINQSERQNNSQKVLLGALIGGVTFAWWLLSPNSRVHAKVINMEDVIKEADSLYDKTDYEGIYKLLYLHKDEKNDEVLWRLGRATYEKAHVAKEPEKQAFFREAFGYVEAALAINKDNFAVHKWMSILIDYVYTYDGNKARISQSYITKQHMERACELKPDDATSWHLLGLWYYNIADIPWYTRKAASLIFATPPEGTFQQALEHFLHAEKLEPGFYSKNDLLIAKCFIHLDKDIQAKIYLLKAKGYPAKTRDDAEAVQEAHKLMKSLKLI